jgi:hypothetical protein
VARLEDPRVPLEPGDLVGRGVGVMRGQLDRVAQQIAEVADQLARVLGVFADQAADRAATAGSLECAVVQP